MHTFIACYSFSMNSEKLHKIDLLFRGLNLSWNYSYLSIHLAFLSLNKENTSWTLSISNSYMICHLTTRSWDLVQFYEQYFFVLVHSATCAWDIPASIIAKELKPPYHHPLCVSSRLNIGYNPWSPLIQTPWASSQYKVRSLNGLKSKLKECHLLNHLLESPNFPGRYCR